MVRAMKEASEPNSVRRGNWGGARVGAGRPPKSGRRNVPHSRREAHRRDRPVLVTLRSRWGSLRTQFVFPTIRLAIAATNKRAARAEGAFKVCEFSVQGDHIHLLVEASSRRALERGVQGLAIRIAKQVNRLWFQGGKFFADRYHAVDLPTPRAVRNGLVYVLGNFRKHDRARKNQAFDVYSSAPYFAAFAELDGVPPCSREPRLLSNAFAPPASPPTEPASTWLLSEGWRQCGTISIWDAPSARPR